MSRKTISLNIVVIIILFLTQVNTAQEVKIITPIGKDLVTNYIKPYTVRKEMIFTRDGQAMPPRIMNDKVVLTEINGEKQLLRIQTIEGIDFIDSSLNVYKNLKPIYHHGHNVGGDLILNFKEGKVTGKKHFTKNDSLFVIDTKMDTPYFDSNIYELVISSLPLAKGYKAKIPTYIFEDGGLSWFEVEVIDEEEFTLSNGSKTIAWKVKSMNRGTTMTLWLSKDEHESLKLVNSVGNNMKVEILKK